MRNDPGYGRRSGHGPPVRWGDTATLFSPAASSVPVRSRQLVSAWSACPRAWLLGFAWEADVALIDGWLRLLVTTGCGSIAPTWDYPIRLDALPPPGAALPTSVGLFNSRSGTFPIVGHTVEVQAEFESSEDADVTLVVSVWVGPVSPTAEECGGRL